MENQVKKAKSPLILGIISCVLWLIPIIGLITSIVGIVMSNKNMKEFKCKAYKIALILNIIGLILTLINYIGFFIIFYTK